MKISLGAVFRDHPASVGETYLQHLTVALGYSLRLFAAGLAALLHGFLPFLCKTSASAAIKEMHAEMAARKARPAPYRSGDVALNAPDGASTH
jgi:hypothetical protein